MSRYLIVTAHFAESDDLEPVTQALRPLKAEGTVGSVAAYDAEKLLPDPDTGEMHTLNDFIEELGLEESATALVVKTTT